MNLAEHVLAAGTACPDKLALSVIGTSRASRWSYGKLTAAVRGCATGLLQAGLHPQDRVLMRLGNHASFPIAFLGALTAGLVPIPTSAQLTHREISKIAAQTRPRLIIAGKDIALPDSPARVITEAEIAAFADLPPADYHQGDAERLAYIIFTSGSSGSPRAVMHAHRSILARQMMFKGWYDLRREDRLMHAGAFNWTYTLGTGLMDPWTVGATALVPAEGTRPEQLGLLAARHGATILQPRPVSFANCCALIGPPSRRCAMGWRRESALIPRCARHGRPAQAPISMKRWAPPRYRPSFPAAQTALPPSEPPVTHRPGAGSRYWRRRATRCPPASPGHWPSTATIRGFSLAIWTNPRTLPPVFAATGSSPAIMPWPILMAPSPCWGAKMTS